MVLTLPYARRVFCDPNPEYRRDTGELLKGIRFPDARNPSSVVDALRKGAFEVTHHFHPDQIARMDPALSHHLHVGPTSRRFEPYA